MPAIKLHKRLPNLSPKEEQIVTEMLCEMYASGFENGKPKWIPVTERLPNVGCNVLFVCENKSYGVGAYSDTYRDFFSGQFPVQNVTHWMPLPEAPKGE